MNCFNQLLFTRRFTWTILFLCIGHNSCLSQDNSKQLKAYDKLLKIVCFSTRTENLSDAIRAEWFISHETYKRSKDAKLSADLFCARLASKIDCTIPTNWKYRIERILDGGVDELNYSANSEKASIVNGAQFQYKHREFEIPQSLQLLPLVHLFQCSDACYIYVVGMTRDYVTKIYKLDVHTGKEVCSEDLACTASAAITRGDGPSYEKSGIVFFTLSAKRLTVFVAGPYLISVDSFNLEKWEKQLSFASSDGSPVPW